MSNLRVARTRNVELLREIALKDKLWEAASEDIGPTKEEFWPDLDALTAIAMIRDEEVVGVMLAHPVSPSVMGVHVLVDPDHWGEKSNAKLGRMACEEILRLHPDALKLTASIPVTDKHVLSYAQRLGFKREGINRSSFRRNGEVVDQTYVGLQRPNTE